MDEVRYCKTKIRGDIIRLDQFLKLIGIADTGGYAKAFIQDGRISVDGSIETHRGRKLRIGDKVRIDSNSGTVYEVIGETEDAP